MATLLTIGHSNLAIDPFIVLLRAQVVELLVDVRRFPGSRKWPHFDRDALAHSLAGAGITYEWSESLGGRRSMSQDAPTSIEAASVAGWENSSFRAYAAYMQTPAFAEAIEDLVSLAERQRCVIMCSESVWWRCHRRLISDAMIARGHTVLHILNAGAPREHALTEFARMNDGKVTYPAPLFDHTPQSNE